jgi:hypothetical protein
MRTQRCGSGSSRRAPTGSVAEAFWGGVPERIEVEVGIQLDPEMMELMTRFGRRVRSPAPGAPT